MHRDAEFFNIAKIFKSFAFLEAQLPYNKIDVTNSLPYSPLFVDLFGGS